MPELPEVQTVVEWLAPNVIGLECIDYRVHREELRTPIENALIKSKNKKVIATRRRAKWPALVFEDGCLWTHLGMTGQLIWTPQNAPPGKHDHFDLLFSNGTVLRYSDARRFGIIAWTDGSNSEPPTKTLGPEPLENGFNGNVLKNGLSRSKKPIKVALMDGHAVVGVGNIYASEALWHAGIHPEAPANTLNITECTKLSACIKHVLQMSLSNGGSTLRDYRRPDGSSGNAQFNHAVYNRAYQPCPTCQKAIKTGVHAGRSTFWCSTCQPWKDHYTPEEQVRRPKGRGTVDS